MASAGSFLTGLLLGFQGARERKQDREEKAKEDKARKSLFEIQMARERRAMEEADRQAQERRQAQKERHDFFGSVLDRMSGTQSQALPGTNVMLGNVDAPAGPQMGLADALAQPDIFIKSMQAGVPLPQAPQGSDYEQKMKYLLGNPDAVALEERLRKSSASNTNVNLPPQETAESRKVGEGFADQYMEIQKAGLNSQGKIARLDRMGQLLQGINTGKLQPTVTQIAAVADSLGIKIDKDLGAKQAAMQLTNEMALQLRNPAGGAGMPGAMSDADRQFLMTMPPGLSQTPEGNVLIIETSKKLAQRDAEVAALARAYRKKNGHMDEGFLDDLLAFSEANPLFPQALPRRPGQEGGQPQVIDFSELPP